jgi:hypothetical protein
VSDSDIFAAGRRGGYPVGARGSYQIKCPACGALPGQRCLKSSNGMTALTTSVRRTHAHPDRVTAWKAQKP